MGCNYSSISVKPHSNSTNSILQLKRRKDAHPKSTDFEVILFYPHVRLLFLQYLTEEHKESDLLLYEGIDELEGIDLMFIHSLINKWFDTFLQNPYALQSLSTTIQAKQFLKVFQTLKNMPVTETTIHHLGNIKIELQDSLEQYVIKFVNSESLNTAMGFQAPPEPVRMSARAQSTQPLTSQISIRAKKSVLVVAINELFGRIISQMLEVDLNCEVIFAKNGEGMNTVLMNKPTDIVLLSTDLPGKGGIQVLSDFLRLENVYKARNPGYVRPYFVCLLSFDSEAMRRNAKAAGFQAMLSFPCNLAECKDAILQKSSSSKLNA